MNALENIGAFLMSFRDPYAYEKSLASSLVRNGGAEDINRAALLNDDLATSIYKLNMAKIAQENLEESRQKRLAEQSALAELSKSNPFFAQLLAINPAMAAKIQEEQFKALEKQREEERIKSLADAAVTSNDPAERLSAALQIAKLTTPELAKNILESTRQESALSRIAGMIGAESQAEDQSPLAYLGAQMTENRQPSNMESVGQYLSGSIGDDSQYAKELAEKEAHEKGERENTDEESKTETSYGGNAGMSPAAFLKEHLGIKSRKDIAEKAPTAIYSLASLPPGAINPEAISLAAKLSASTASDKSELKSINETASKLVKAHMDAVSLRPSMENSINKLWQDNKTLAEQIDRAKELIRGGKATGWFAASMPIGQNKSVGMVNIPGTDAKELYEIMKTIKSTKFLKEIENIKKMSKTGATGLGALSDMEGEKLEQAHQTLKTEIGNDRQLIENLDRFMNAANNYLAAVMSDYKKAYGASDEDIHKIINERQQTLSKMRGENEGNTIRWKDLIK